jgi:hypothetical protein
LADISRKDDLLGFKQQDEGLPSNVQIDLGVVPAIAVLGGWLLGEVGLYLG